MSPPSDLSPLIFGVEGLRLSASEREFLREYKPLGFILFARNIESPEQVKELIAEVKALGTVLVLVDQEGGRVQRLKPPYWQKYPPMREIAEKSADPLRASWLLGRLLAYELSELGINVDCAPVLDVPIAGAHDVIGDRAFSLDPLRVGQLGRKVAEGLLAGGVLPVIKHIPGHGRAMADSHLELPKVEASREELAQDLSPFKALADMPLAMTAHVLYPALDKFNPATTSPYIVGKIIREEIGFKGLLMTDDLAMSALEGDMRERAKKSLEAGCDILLHCNGKREEMLDIARACNGLKVEGNEVDKLMSLQKGLKMVNFAEALSEFKSLITNA